MGIVTTRSLQGVIHYDDEKACNGYTIVSPTYSGDIWLIDMCGQVVHHWAFPYRAGFYAKLLPNGNLLCQARPRRSGRTTVPPVAQRDFNALSDDRAFFAGGLRQESLAGYGGIIFEMDWEGNLVHKYLQPRHNHDVCYITENEHLMVIRFEPVPSEIAAKVEGGLPGTEMDGKMICDAIDEVDWEGNVHWTWLSWKHLDPALDFICPLEPRREWTHANSVSVLPDGRLLISCRDTCSLYIIDKSTGKIEWRWGWGEVWHQHDATLVENGNVMCFDNGAHRVNSDLAYSRVIEVNPKTKEIEWEYKADPPSEFYSAVMSGAQRLPNGNTLICSTDRGRIFEVTRGKEVVWSYVCPFYGSYFVFGRSNALYRAYRYPSDYEGLRGKTVDPTRFETVNKAIGATACR